MDVSEVDTLPMMNDSASSVERSLQYWKGRRVAITGATGFVGYHVARSLLAQGAQLIALVRAGSDRNCLLAAGAECAEAPLADVARMARACSGCEFLFHIAGAVDFGDDWKKLRQLNMGGTQNVVTAARAAGVRRVVHTSSIVAVGATYGSIIQDETAPWTLGNLRIPYVTTKREAEDVALSATGIDVVVVNPACVLGPDDFTASEFGTLCRRFWFGRLPIHFGGGNNFVDVRDVASGHLLAAQLGRVGQRYLLSGTNRTTTGFFADLARAADRSIPRFRLPSSFGSLVALLNERIGRRPGQRAYLTFSQARLLGLFFFFNCAKARRELGYAPRPLARTLADSHDFWMKRHAA